MQQRMMAVKEELASRTYEGVSGAGAVRVVVTGSQRLASVAIGNDVLDDPEMLGDLIVVAANQALEASAAEAQQAMGGLTGSIDLGGLLG